MGDTSSEFYRGSPSTPVVVVVVVVVGHTAILQKYSVAFVLVFEKREFHGGYNVMGERGCVVVCGHTTDHRVIGSLFSAKSLATVVEIRESLSAIAKIIPWKTQVNLICEIQYALRATRDQLSPWSSPSTRGRGVFHLHNSVDGTTHRSDLHCAAMPCGVNHSSQPFPIQGHSQQATTWRPEQPSFFADLPTTSLPPIRPPRQSSALRHPTEISFVEKLLYVEIGTSGAEKETARSCQ